MVQLPLHSVNVMRRCFELSPIIVKGGTHTYNMIKDEQLPKSVMKRNIDARIC